MERRDIEEFQKDWRRLMRDIEDKSKELDENQESKVRELLDELEREGERILERIQDVLKTW